MFAKYLHQFEQMWAVKSTTRSKFTLFLPLRESIYYLVVFCRVKDANELTRVWQTWSPNMSRSDATLWILTHTRCLFRSAVAFAHWKLRFQYKDLNWNDKLRTIRSSQPHQGLKKNLAIFSSVFRFSDLENKNGVYTFYIGECLWCVYLNSLIVRRGFILQFPENSAGSLFLYEIRKK